MKRFDWTRYCIRTFEQDTAYSGFLPELVLGEQMVMPRLSYRSPAWTAAETFLNERCIVLLGQPGIGKSDTLRQLQEQSQQVQTLLVELRDYNSRVALREDLFGEDPLVSWQEGNGPLHLFLDGLDEGLLGTRQLHRELLKILKKLPEAALQRLWLRLSCRSGRWPTAFAKDLQAIWPDESIATVRLGPLRERDAHRAAETVLGSAEKADAFMEAVRDHQAEGLASIPDTLSLLLDSFTDTATAQLTTNRVELYRRGLMHLMRDGERRGRLSESARIALAERMAAATLFSNQAGIWSRDFAQAESAWVSLETIAFESETVYGVEVRASQDNLHEEVLKRGPFLPRRDGRGYRWQSQRHAEFLAASYLKRHKVPPTLLWELLIHPDAKGTVLVPQLMGTASWIAELLPGAWEMLLRSAPRALLLSDLTLRDDEARLSLARALLSGLASEQINPDLMVLLPQLKKLTPKTEQGSAALFELLRQWLTDNVRPEVSRWLAAEIAGECHLAELVEPLLETALDVNAPYIVRKRSFEAMIKASPQKDCLDVCWLLLTPDDFDPDEDMFGSALRALWRPRTIDAATLLSWLRPPRRLNYLGTYRVFLEELFSTLRDDELVTAVRWMRQHPRSDTERGYLSRDGLQEFLRRCLERLDDLPLLDALFALITNRDWHLYHFPLAEVIGDGRAPGASELLDRLARALGRHPQTRNLHAARQVLIARFCAKPDTKLGEVIVSNSYFTQREELAELFSLHTRFPEQMGTFSRHIERYGEDIDGFIARIKEEWKPDEPEPPPLNTELPFTPIATLMQKYPAHKESWPLIWEQLHISPEEGHAERKDSILEYSRWRALSSVEHAQITDAAVGFLEEAGLLNEGQRYRAEFIARTADLVEAVRPEALRHLSDERWERWTPSLLEGGYAIRDQPRKKRILSIIQQRAPATAAQRIDGFIRDGEVFDWGIIERVWAPPVAAIAKRHLAASAPGSRPFQLLLRMLIQSGDDETIERASEWVAEQTTDHNRRSLAAAALLLHADNNERIKMLDRLAEEEPLLREVFKDLVKTTQIGKPILPNLSIGLAGYLTHLLTYLYPPSSNAEFSTAAWLSDVDRLRVQRDLLVRFLVSNGDWATVEVLEKLRDKHQGVWPALSWYVHQARENAGVATWSPSTPDSIVRRIRSAYSVDIEGVGALLCSLFGTEELKVFIVEYDPGMTSRLPDGASLLEYAHAYQQLVRQDGVLNRAWFEQLIKARPERADDIREIQKRVVLQHDA